MSLTVRHLNGDSTFLLIFHHNTNPSPSDLCSANGAFSVLIDPWFTGSSIVNAPWFAITHRVLPAAVNHMSELEEPDLILVSQNKPDHCHKETLLQLNPHGKTLIAAEPGAAKFIKTWNHFDPNRVIGFSKYDPKARFGNSLRVRIPPLGPDGLPGELNIAFIPAKNYVTGLHNAYGITYLPPTKFKALTPMTTIDLPKLKTNTGPQRSTSNSTVKSAPIDHTGTIVTPEPLSARLSPGSEAMQFTNDFVRGHRPKLSRSSNTQSSELLSTIDLGSIKYSDEDVSNRTTVVSSVSTTSGTGRVDPLSPTDFFNFAESKSLPSTQALPTPPQSPDFTFPFAQLYTTNSHGAASDGHSNYTVPLPTNKTSFSLPSSPNLRYSRAPTFYPARPKAVSVLYSPHGVPVPDLKPYISNHLVKLPGALPLALLLHSFDHTQNPWWFGGNIMAGAENGIEIAKALMAKTWISAHDEDKDDRGVAVKLLKIRKAQAEEIRKKLLVNQHGQRVGWTCDVRTLELGTDLVLNGEVKDMRYNDKPGLGRSDMTMGLGEEVRMAINMRGLKAT